MGQARLPHEMPERGREYPTLAYDLSSALERALRQHRDGKAINREDVAALVEHLRRNDCSLGDLCRAIETLKEQRTAESNGTEPEAALEAWRALDAILNACLLETAAIHEAVLERTLRAYCEVDRAGVIVYANDAMLELLPSCRGQRLSSHFGAQAGVVESALGSGEARQLFQLQLQRGDNLVPIEAEFGSIRIDGEQRGCYAIFVDTSCFEEAEQRAYDASPFGVVKLDASLRIAFANTAALAIFGIARDELYRCGFKELFLDETSRQLIEEEIEKRKRGEGSQYELIYHRVRDNKTIPLQIYAGPRYDFLGNWTGAWAMIQSLEILKAREAIHRACEQTRKSSELFESVLKIVRTIVPFDVAMLWHSTEDMGFASPLHSFPDFKPDWSTRWFQVTPKLRHWIEGEKTWGSDLPSFLDPDSNVGESTVDPIVFALAAEGYHSFLCYPIRQESAVIAVLVILGKDQNSPYTEQQQQLLGLLGTEQAIRMTLQAHEDEERTFVARLLQRIAAAPSSEAAARELVTGLSRFYKWQNVSILKVNRIRGNFQLLAQARGPRKGYLLPGSWEQPLDKGLLGYVYKTKKPVNLPDVTGSDPLARLYCKSNPQTRSEVCLPVWLRTRARQRRRMMWILNLEDRRSNAFQGQEIKTLNRVVGELERTIERLFQNVIFDQTLEAVNNGIVVTDVAGRIRRCNKAALRMLQLTDRQANRRRITDFIVSAYHEQLQMDNKIDRIELEVKGGSGAVTPVMLSLSVLPHEEYDHKVILLEDLKAIRRNEELSAIGGAVDEVTAETRVPLSLASSLMQRVSRLMSDGSLREVCEKAVQQLGKVELTYERVLATHDRVVVEPTLLPLDLRKLLTQVLNELPASERKAIKRRLPSQLPVVHGDSYRLGLCIKSILAYLLRDKPPSRHLQLRVKEDLERNILISIVGPEPVNSAVSSEAFTLAREAARARVALGGKMLREIIETEHKGTLVHQRTKNGDVKFTLRVPAAG